jgi:putative thiamine transport system permease protein
MSLHPQHHHTAALVLLALVGVPLLWSLWGAAAAALDPAAWAALVHDPQTLRALDMSLWTGLLSSLLAISGAAFVLSRSFGQPAWPRVVQLLGPMLAVPHAAFAIGLVFLIAPSGWLLRALSPWATGFDAPPPWLTTQDPWGLGLIAVLAFKEIPFLLWAALGHLQRPDVARRLQQELQVAQTLGYSPRTAWWRLAWPQIWPRLSGPMLAVLAYGLTVVDVALVIGPTSPPTLSVLAWQWLRDADPAMNAQGRQYRRGLGLGTLARVAQALGTGRTGSWRRSRRDPSAPPAPHFWHKYRYIRIHSQRHRQPMGLGGSLCLGAARAAGGQRVWQLAFSVTVARELDGVGLAIGGG